MIAVLLFAAHSCQYGGWGSRRAVVSVVWRIGRDSDLRVRRKLSSAETRVSPPLRSACDSDGDRVLLRQLQLEGFFDRFIAGRGCEASALIQQLLKCDLKSIEWPSRIVISA